MYPYYELIAHDCPSYQHWVLGIDSGAVWGDETVMVAISLMWNIAITCVTPQGLVPIHHRRRRADVYILCNGAPGGDNYHFSATGRLLSEYIVNYLFHHFVYSVLRIYLYSTVSRTRRALVGHRQEQTQLAPQVLIHDAHAHATARATTVAHNWNLRRYQ